MKTNTGILVVLVAILAQTSSSALRPLPDPLPLAVGNTWTYTKKVPKGKLYCVTAWVDTNGKCYVEIVPDIKVPLTSTETYKIACSSEGGYEVAVSSSSGTDNDVRDGRYWSGNTVIWKKRGMQSQYLKNLDSHVICGIVEEIIGPRSGVSLSAVLDSEDVTCRRPLTLIWRLLSAGAESSYGLRVGTPGSNTWDTNNQPMIVRTPAGTFRNCILSTERIILSGVRSSSNQKNTSAVVAIIHSYYCPGVGLVKEVEKTPDGEVLYTMELKSYHLAR